MWRAQKKCKYSREIFYYPSTKSLSVSKGFVHVRIWFPQFPGVVMQSDQELIIMCKPPEPTIIENKAAGFAGSL